MIFPFGIDRDRHALDEMRHRARFLADVQSLTGRAEADAARLMLRLDALARGSRGMSARGYRDEWRNRYIWGWGSSEIRHSVAVRKATMRFQGAFAQ